VSRHVAEIPLLFQRFSLTVGGSMQHERDMGDQQIIAMLATN
jgi:hypothetical protein